jgi:hypothetical protein
MRRILKASPLFVFFCLSCFQQIGPYRDIEIVVQGVDFATVKFYNQDSALIATEYFDREYAESLHVGYIEDGKLRIQLQTRVNRQQIDIDTLIEYQSRFSWLVNF